MSDEQNENDDDKIVQFRPEDEPSDAEREAEFKRLRTFCEQLREAGAERVVLRWIDEKRPVETEDGGMSIQSVRELTVKGAIDGELTSCSVELVPAEIAKSLLRRFDFEIVERNDNLT